MTSGIHNYELTCRYAACYKPVHGGVHFCEEHARYQPLTRALFQRQNVGTGYDGEPLTAVYVIGCRRTEAIKIGIAVDVIARIGQLQTGYPYPLKLYGAFYTKRQWAEHLERACHKKLKGFGLHLNGEWFEAEPDDAVRLVEKMADLEGKPVLTAGEYGTMMAQWEDIDHAVYNHLFPVRQKIKKDWAKELIDNATVAKQTRL